MSEADATAGQAAGEREQAEYRIEIGGNAEGPVIAGNYNLLVDAQHGSSVTLLMERERPRPIRRSRVELLPRRQEEPVGRDVEIVALTEAVRAGGPVQLYGPPGIGKSALMRYAARLLEPGPDGVVFLTAAHREAEDLAQEVFEACYETTGYAPSRAELRRLMAGVRVTVYVDNADFPAEQLLELMDAAPDAIFVFAGRGRSLGSEGTVLELEGLDRTAGLELLARELRRPLPESDHAAATDLWQAAAGRPLPLLRAAGLARFDSPGNTMRLPRPGEVDALLPLLFDQLDAAELNVLHLLATLHDAELDPVHIGALTEVPDAAGMCERLAGLGLLVAAENRYRLAADAGPAVRVRRPDPFPADRLCAYFVRWVTQETPPPAAVADHGRALEQVAKLAEWTGRPDLAVQVTRAASAALARSLRFGVWGRLLGRGWAAAQDAGDRHATAYFLHEEGIRSLLTGKRVLAAALVAEALVLWRQLSDGQAVTAALHAQQHAPPALAAGAHGGGATAAQTAAAAPGGSASAPHAASAAHGTTSHEATVHMAELGQSPAGHGAATQLPHTAGHATGTAGGVHAAAGTAAGVSLGTMVLSVAVIVAALAIGAISIAQQQAPSSQASSSQPPAIVSTAPANTAVPANTDLAGVWADDEGVTTEFFAAGAGSYTAQQPGPCGPIEIRLTGSAGSYSGTQTLYEVSLDGTCEPVGHHSITIDVAPDGTTAQVVQATAPGQPSCTAGCGTFTLERR